MLTIRLSRIGKRKKPMYRLIISEKARDTYGKALEILGSYNPFSKELSVKQDRIQYWLSQGSGMSATVNNLLIQNDIIKGEKVKASKPGKKSEAEIQAEAKAAAAAAAAKAPKPEEAKVTEETAVEAPVEEAK
ncbi:MAG: 30S ribosomal protein S16 [Candidatus Magasanikbacteria bacterium]|nr:30S ribosomal protein S16 [Candidatus Magasanikbacteria bacterium]